MFETGSVCALAPGLTGQTRYKPPLAGAIYCAPTADWVHVFGRSVRQVLEPAPLPAEVLSYCPTCHVGVRRMIV